MRLASAECWVRYEKVTGARHTIYSMVNKMAKRSDQKLAPRQVGVKTIPTQELHPNPHNPRLLFDREPMQVLKASIEKVGILVPLTVYWEGARKRFVILDGQRRWMCATDLKLKEVPVNVVREPTLAQNIVTMFQIHKLREDWELMPTALKLEVLMTELRERNEKRLAELTGLDQAVVGRCKKLLSFSRKYQDMMLDPDPKVRVKADFFIELYAVRNDRLVNKMEWFKRDAFTKRMLDKYLARSGAIKSVTDFRIMKQHINNARKANRVRVITRRLREFTESDDLGLEHLVIASADASATARRVTKALSALVEQVRAMDVQELYGEEEMWKLMESLVRLIERKLEAAGRRRGA